MGIYGDLEWDFTGRHPLVHVYVTMRKINKFLAAIFNSYVIHYQRVSGYHAITTTRTNYI